MLSDKEFHGNFKYEHLIQAPLAVFHASENPDYKAMGSLTQTSRTIQKQRGHIIGCGYGQRLCIYENRGCYSYDAHVIKG